MKRACKIASRAIEALINERKKMRDNAYDSYDYKTAKEHQKFIDDLTKLMEGLSKTI